MVKGEGNPRKRARPTSVQDVLLSGPDGADAQAQAPGGKPAAAAKGSNAHTLTVKEVMQRLRGSAPCYRIIIQAACHLSAHAVFAMRTDVSCIHR